MSRVAHPAGPQHAGVLPPGHPPAPPADVNALDPAIWPRTAVRRDGALRLGGMDVRDLAARFGTPLFACDEEDFRSRCRDFREAFGVPPAERRSARGGTSTAERRSARGGTSTAERRSARGGTSTAERRSARGGTSTADGDGVFYAAKAFCCRTVLRWVSDEGLGIDVCTGGELEVALQAGVAPENITLHGSNKLPAELHRAVAAGVGHIVADSFEEIGRLVRIAGGGHARPRVLVRVTTGVEAATHEFVATAHDDQKFGFSLASGAADEAVRQVLASDALEFAGLHSHIGSQIYDTAGFEVAAHRVLELAARIRNSHGIDIGELNLGGGFGIAYVPGDDPADVKVVAQNLREIVDSQCRAAGLARPRLTVEPGRAIAGPGTVTLYEVGTVKDVDGLRTYVSVDGGMSDNVRTALYDAEYTCVLASRESRQPPVLCRVVGRHCESGDIVVRDCYLPGDVHPGDLLAVAATGAYCRSMASNYNHVPRPGVVAVRDGAARVMLRRETTDDLLLLDAG